eukprot:XP_001698920.1 predicted protein [Chlamydomonas reinhardtii]
MGKGGTRFVGDSVSVRCMPGSAAGLAGTAFHKLLPRFALYGGRNPRASDGVRLPSNPHIRAVEGGLVAVGLDGEDVVLLLDRALALDSSHQVVGRVHKGREMLDKVGDLRTLPPDDADALSEGLKRKRKPAAAAAADTGSDSDEEDEEDGEGGKGAKQKREGTAEAEAAGGVGPSGSAAGTGGPAASSSTSPTAADSASPADVAATAAPTPPLQRLGKGNVARFGMAPAHAAYSRGAQNDLSADPLSEDVASTAISISPLSGAGAGDAAAAGASASRLEPQAVSPPLSPPHPATGSSAQNRALGALGTAAAVIGTAWYFYALWLEGQKNKKEKQQGEGKKGQAGGALLVFEDPGDAEYAANVLWEDLVAGGCSRRPPGGGAGGRAGQGAAHGGTAAGATAGGAVPAAGGFRGARDAVIEAELLPVYTPPGPTDAAMEEALAALEAAESRQLARDAADAAAGGGGSDGDEQEEDEALRVFSETGGAIGDDGDGGDPGGEDPDPLGELLPGYTDGGCRGYGCGALYLPNIGYPDGSMGFLQVNVSLSPDRRDMRVLAFADRADATAAISLLAAWPQYAGTDPRLSIMPTATIMQQLKDMYDEQPGLNSDVVVYQYAAQRALARTGYGFTD